MRRNLISHNISSLNQSRPLPAIMRLRPPNEKGSISRSASRALVLLEFFGVVRRPLRLKEISSELQLNTSTASQLLKTLVDSGHMLFDAVHKTYVPSPRLEGFCGWLVDGTSQASDVKGWLAALSRRAEEYVALFSQNGVHMQIIDTACPPHRDRPADDGIYVPLIGSASGAALLAQMPDVEVNAWMDRARMPEGDRSEYVRSLSVVRSQGYAYGGVSTDMKFHGIAVAFPWSIPGFPLVAAIGGPSARIEHERTRLVEILQEMLPRTSP